MAACTSGASYLGDRPLVTSRHFPARCGYSILIRGPSRTFAAKRDCRARAVEDGESPEAEEQKGQTLAERLKSQYDSRRAKERALDEEMPYSDNWDGDVYIGSNWNVLTVLLLISAAVPIGGLVFAYFSYGVLWGIGSQSIAGQI